MIHFVLGDQLPLSTDDVAQTACVIARCGQARTRLRSIESEASEDGDRVRRCRRAQYLEIALAGFSGCQEMEDCSVVPDSIPTGRAPRQKIGTNPRNATLLRSDPYLSNPHRFVGDVKDRDITKPAIKQSVDQSRRTATNVNESVADIGADCGQHRQRGDGYQLIPAPIHSTEGVGAVPVLR